MNHEPHANGELASRSPNAPAATDPASADSYAATAAVNVAPKFGPADLLPFLNALRRRWLWLVMGGVALALVGLVGGSLFWKNSYTASAQLLRQTSAHVLAVLGERELDPNTYASLLRAPELLERVAAQASPPLLPELLARKLNITPERNSDVLMVAVSTANQQSAVDLANLYAREAVKFTQEMQTNAAAQVSLFVTQQLTPLEAEITALYQPLPPVVGSVVVRREVAVAPSSPLRDKLQTARLELAELQAKYQDRHPFVREQQARIAAIESQLQQIPVAPPPAAELVADASATPRAPEREPALFQSKMQSLESARLTLLGQKQAAQTVGTHPPGTCQLLAPATLKEVIPHKRTAKVAALTGFGGLLGFLLACALVLLAEAVDPRLKTAADVKRVTGLPVVASAGDLGKMSDAEQKNWAFQALTSVQRLLSPSPNQGFVCGITSSENGEGRSTWIRLLAEAASQRGFRVLTIVAEPPQHNGHSTTTVAAEPPVNGTFDLETTVSTNGNRALVASHLLSTPEEVTRQLMGPNPEPVVHIPLPGWVWNLERRKQWHAALRHWSQIDNIALLVELPPASMPETVLLAENLPNLLWLADGEKATAASTREQLETLRNARCHLAGAVMNRAPVTFLKNSVARWLGVAVLVCGLQGWNAPGQQPQLAATNATPGGANTNLSWSVVSPSQRAAWQEHLTLGPGDVVNLSLWGEPALTHAEVAIGPDGRISFAEAQDVLATGLTVDELREKMNEELGKYRRAPQAMITPVAFRSKKYYVLGRVMTKGVYLLDRPITILEAVARAHGFETGLVNRNIITVADFSRSFLMRQGKRTPLNFEKLFQSGDLSQNLSIEPGDYLYFPGANVQEVYVLGEVRLPGATPYTPQMTLMAAITSRAGYTDRAWKGKVLVVRGSLNKPEVFAVETKDILAAKIPDFRLQPKDIIFVNSRPFIYGEELADRAISTFLQSLVSASTGIYAIQPYQNPP